MLVREMGCFCFMILLPACLLASFCFCMICWDTWNGELVGLVDANKKRQRVAKKGKGKATRACKRA